MTANSANTDLRSRASSVEYLNPNDLKPFHGNARTHSDEQISRLVASVREFGFVAPVLIDEVNGIIAGHARVEAAKRANLTRVPCIRVSHLTEAQRRAYIIADNHLAESASWDRQTLAQEFRFLADFDFNVELTGFATAEIDLILEEDQSQMSTDPVDVVAVPDPERSPVTRSGDLWQLGAHKLYCGNALESAAYRQVLGKELAQQVITDPPYNVPIDGHVSGLGQIKHRAFAMASGEMSRAGFTEFLKTVCSNLAGRSVDGALHFMFMDWRHVGEMQAAGEAAFSELKNICVWAKTNGGMGSLYRSRHELVFVWKSGIAPHINNVDLGRHGRYRTNVWEYAGVNSFGHERSEALAMHPTVKPVALIADAIRDCSRRGGLILDPFAGSGTTILAAERTGRQARTIELDAGYVDVAVERFQTVTGQVAVHAETGLSFAETKQRRALETPARPYASSQDHEMSE